MTSEATTRMPAAQRRALIVDAARELFGRNGYNGTTTDQIATAAGISQPYVVRMFGTKEALFIEALGGALDELMAAWRDALRAAGDDPHDRARLIGERFIDLAASRGLHTMLLQGFVSGAEPAIGAAARQGFLAIYRFLRDEAGVPDEQVQGFLGSGMLFSVMLAIEMPSLFGTDDDADGLLRAAFGEKCLQVVELARRA
jgi:TetR/AcrR family transcriptional regulator